MNNLDRLSTKTAFFLGLTALLSGCTPKTPPSNAGQPTVTPATQQSGTSPAGGGLRFAEVAEKSGINYLWEVQGKRPLTILQTIGNGCAFFDYDNDGNLDILLVGRETVLYKGDGKGKFSDVSAATGIGKLTGHLLGCAVGDYDNDGFADVYLSAYRGGVLLHNQGGKAFSNVTKSSGIAAQPWASSCSFADLDGDGKLDLYICNYAQFGPNTKPQLCEFNGILSSCGPKFYLPEKGVVYRNLGSGKFQDVTKAAGADKVSGRALGVAIADFDSSGRQSIAIANDELHGDLLHNLGKTRFKNVGTESGTATDSDGNVHGGMGIDWGDYDNDGKLDLFVATFQHEAKNVYRNEGDGLFTDNSARLGLVDKTAEMVTFGVKWFDADNDGHLDLILANGHVQDNIAAIDKAATYRQPIKLFRNLSGTGFEDAGKTAGAIFEQRFVGRGLAVGDYDNDGKMDALVVDSEGKPLLLHNETPAAGSWLLLKLVGSKGNRDGIGALVTVEADGKKLLRHSATDGSYLSASDRRVHFGLGKAATATITVKWTNGTTTVKDVPVNQVLTVREEGQPAVSQVSRP